MRAKRPSGESDATDGSPRSSPFRGHRARSPRLDVLDEESRGTPFFVGQEKKPASVLRPMNVVYFFDLPPLDRPLGARSRRNEDQPGPAARGEPRQPTCRPARAPRRTRLRVSWQANHRSAAGNRLLVRFRAGYCRRRKGRRLPTRRRRSDSAPATHPPCRTRSRDGGRAARPAPFPPSRCLPPRPREVGEGARAAFRRDSPHGASGRPPETSRTRALRPRDSMRSLVCPTRETARATASSSWPERSITWRSKPCVVCDSVPRRGEPGDVGFAIEDLAHGELERTASANDEHELSVGTPVGPPHVLGDLPGRSPAERRRLQRTRGKVEALILMNLPGNHGQLASRRKRIPGWRRGD